MGNPQGDEALAQELVGSELAAYVGLTVPEFAVLTVADLQIETVSGRPLNFGPAFISQALDQPYPADSEGTCLKRLRSKEDLALLIAFDTWVRNADRCPPPDHLVPEPNRDNLMFRSTSGWFDLIAFDHTHCFAEADLETEMADERFVTDTGVYGAFPEFLPYVDESSLRLACAKIVGVDGDTVMEIIASVPTQWGPSAAVRERWAQQIINRAQQVENYVISSLVGQGQLGV